jgi:hypothetical protein
LASGAGLDASLGTGIGICLGGWQGTSLIWHVYWYLAW